MAVVTMKQLLEAGVHFGHQTRRWNPKMRRYIFTDRGGIYILDLIKTLGGIEESYIFIRDLVARGGIVLFIGTKKQIQEAVEQEARRVGMPYVSYRWLGGMLTNFQTIYKRIQRLRELEQLEAQGAFEESTKKEALKLRHEMEKLRHNLAGIRDLNRPPDAIFILDTKKEAIAVKEARRLGIPIIAVVDTNCDPDEVDYVIPGNDDAIRSGALLARVVADAVADGLKRRPPDVVAAAEAEASGVMLTSGEAQPPAEWEIMLAQQETEDAARRARRDEGPTDTGAAEGEEKTSVPGEDIDPSALEDIEPVMRPLLVEEDIPEEEFDGKFGKDDDKERR